MVKKSYRQKKENFTPKPDDRDNVFDGNISEDEVEQFHDSKLNFDSVSEASEDLLDDEVLAMSDDMEEALRKVPALREHMREQSDSDSGDEEDDEWGKRKSAFYNDDIGEDDDAAFEEEEEAQRIQQDKLEQMSDADFIDESLGAMIKNGQKLSSEAKLQSDASDEEEVDREVPNFGDMTSEQIDQYVQQEAPELKQLLQEFEEKAKELNDGPATRLLEKVSDTSDGISLLEVKNQILVNYLLNLTFYFYMRLDGVGGVLESKSHEVVQRMVEYRLFLEKIKPLEAKVRYQVDKLVKATVVQTSEVEDQVEEQDPLNYKPSLDNFVVPDNQVNSEDDGIYQPPRIAPVHYDDDVKSKVDRKKEREDRRLAQAAAPSRVIMQEMVAEMNDLPEEIHDAGNMLHYNNAAKSSVDRKWEERAKAEEELMMRVTTSKKDKKEVHQQQKLVDEMAQLEAFGDFARLRREDDDFDLAPISKAVQLEQSSAEEQEPPSEDEYYKEQLDNQEAKKELKRNLQEPLEVESMEENEEMDGKRQIGYDIMKNKGLTPKRSKEQRNPRVKRRKKYERSMTKLKSVKSVHREQSGTYKGEETGIKKNLTRSVKYK